MIVGKANFLILLCIFLILCPFWKYISFFSFFFFFSVCFSVVEISVEMTLNSEILSSTSSSLPISHQRHSLFLLQCFFWFFLRIINSFLILPPFLHAVYLSIWALSVWIIVVLNSWSGKSDIPTISESGFDACSAFQMMSFTFQCPL